MNDFSGVVHNASLSQRSRKPGHLWRTHCPLDNQLLLVLLLEYIYKFKYGAATLAKSDFWLALGNPGWPHPSWRGP